MDQAVATAWLMLQQADVDPLDVARACEMIKAFADARQLSAIQDLYAETPTEIDPTGQEVDPNPAELAAALHWTPATAQRRADLAEDLLVDLRCVHDALRIGLIDLAKAREIANGTCELDADVRADLASEACDYAALHTTGQLRAWLARRLASIDPEATRRRRKKACARRRVWIEPESDGMATLGAYLSAEEAQACYHAINAAVARGMPEVWTARAKQLHSGQAKRLLQVLSREPDKGRRRSRCRQDVSPRLPPQYSVRELPQALARDMPEVRSTWLTSVTKCGPSTRSVHVLRRSEGR